MKLLIWIVVIFAILGGPVAWAMVEQSVPGRRRINVETFLSQTGLSRKDLVRILRAKPIAPLFEGDGDDETIDEASAAFVRAELGLVRGDRPIARTLRDIGIAVAGGVAATKLEEDEASEGTNQEPRRQEGFSIIHGPAPGTVQYYRPDIGYGYITLITGDEVLVEADEVAKAGRTTLHDGEGVMVRYRLLDDRLVAFDLRTTQDLLISSSQPRTV